MYRMCSIAASGVTSDLAVVCIGLCHILVTLLILYQHQQNSQRSTFFWNCWSTCTRVKYNTMSLSHTVKSMKYKRNHSKHAQTASHIQKSHKSLGNRQAFAHTTNVNSNNKQNITCNQIVIWQLYFCICNFCLLWMQLQFISFIRWLKIFRCHREYQLCALFLL